MHIANKMASSCSERSQGIFTARKLASPVTKTKQTLQDEQYPQQENYMFCNTEKFVSANLRLSTRPIAVAATRFCLGHIHSHCRNTLPDDDDYNDHDVNAPSVWLSLFWLTSQSMEASCGQLHVSCGKVCVCERVRFLQQPLWENPSVAGFLGALRGVGGRLSQFCGAVAHVASTIILSGEQ